MYKINKEKIGKKLRKNTNYLINKHYYTHRDATVLILVYRFIICA